MSSADTTTITVPLGRIVMTTHAAQRLTPREMHDGLRRHAAGDWGDLGPEDAAQNDQSVRHGGRLFSAYGAGDRRFWIITGEPVGHHDPPAPRLLSTLVASFRTWLNQQPTMETEP